MNRHIITIIVMLLALPAMAGVDKTVLESIVNVSTVDAGGNPLGEALGFAIVSSQEGSVEILAPYTPFNKAAAATITTGKGNKIAVHRITGANDLYDVVRFTVADQSVPVLKPAQSKAIKGQKVSVLTGIVDKKKLSREVTVTETTEYSGLTYYTLDMVPDNSLIGSPVLNSSNEVVAVIQRGATNETSTSYAIGIEFNTALEITTMSAADQSLNNILIPKQLPADEKQAASYLYLLTKNSEDTLSYKVSLGDYIEAYPTSAFGYTQRASYYIATGQYVKAEADYEQGLQICENKSDIHNSMSEDIYHLNQSTAYQTYKDWTLERALSEAEEAYQAYNSPTYLMQKGRCLYALKRYQEAHDVYDEINKTDFRSSENLYYQSRSLEMAGGDTAQVLALLDSAVVRFKRPLREDAAPYIYYRAQRYDMFGRYREAVVGYQEYQELVGKRNLNDLFFFNKEQAEIKCHFYPQALNDIEEALAIKPDEYVYHIERALIQTRMGNYEEALFSAQQAQKLDSEDPDSYKLIGISQGELGNKAEARKNLQRALELGDEDAAEWLKSMK